jgi:hypothetical protein
MDLQKFAEQKFGKQRAEELREDIQQVEDDLERLRSVPLELEDEP